MAGLRETVEHFSKREAWESVSTSEKWTTCHKSIAQGTSEMTSSRADVFPLIIGLLLQFYADIYVCCVSYKQRDKETPTWSWEQLTVSTCRISAVSPYSAVVLITQLPASIEISSNFPVLDANWKRVIVSPSVSENGSNETVSWPLNWT